MMTLKTPAARYIFATVLYTECIVGIIMNLFIVAANFMRWKTVKSLHIGDTILSSLATSRSLFLFNVFVTYLPPVRVMWVNKNLQVLSAMSAVSMFLHSTNLWFTTILCVFYCVKISSYNWKFFNFLKTRISTLFPRFLLASLLISIFSSLPFGWCIYEIQIQNPINFAMENMTLPKVGIYENPHNKFLLFLVSSCPPFLIFLVADFLLIHSLWQHTRRMRISGSGFRNPNLESHFSAVKSMSLFLVLHIIYFICSSLYFSGDVYNSGSEFWISSIVICSPPSLHSLYIISSNSELRKTFISMFHIFTCCGQEQEEQEL
ncbi:taste receptor type 2 member 9-like [Phyllobates terribilis]|uniref:taste receptor type 2 member 9-like n=1 Tax=Phyllobates terribilis TaxID=111132 RepID=UPI003CCAD230